MAMSARTKTVGAIVLVVGAVGFLALRLLGGGESSAAVAISDTGHNTRTVRCESCGNEFQMTDKEYGEAIAKREGNSGKLTCPKCGQKAAWRVPPSDYKGALTASPEQIREAVPEGQQDTPSNDTGEDQAPKKARASQSVGRIKG